MSLYPLIFVPLFKERVWGGRRLAHLYGKPLPPGVPIGESWEIADRPWDESVIANGPLAGSSLRWLMQEAQDELLGRVQPLRGRFPLLVKILDARERLSVQVHPPASVAVQLGGEPKTEMWFITHADAGAELFVGLRQGMTRQQFQEAIVAGKVAECLHRVQVQAGDVMFLPGGRVHAIGAGNVLFEIQQNSDTTYRVFDWNRLGLDGRPRQLHVAQSLASIDFHDYEPQPQRSGEPLPLCPARRLLVDAACFRVEQWTLKAGELQELRQREWVEIIGVISGELRVAAPGGDVALRAGSFCLLPASCEPVQVMPLSQVSLLLVRPGGSLG